MKKKRIAVIGTVGVPASYGGFESLVENLLNTNDTGEIEYTVFCSSKDMPKKRKEYKHARLRYVPLHANGSQSVLYDFISLLRSVRGYDVLLILGVSGCLFLPLIKLLSKAKIVINIDGLEHRRDKWGRLAKFILKSSEASAVRFADTIIADNKGIQDYVSNEYKKPSILIEYGGDHVKRSLSEDKIESILYQYGVQKGNYAITVCRIEPENNSHIILESFKQTGDKLVFIGNWNHSAYSISLKEKYSKYKNILLLDAIYDLDILYCLRSNAGAYIHGHSAGGTNPSLVEAMFFGIPIIAYDVIYNRETTENKAIYFSDIESMKKALRVYDHSAGDVMYEIAKRRYKWRMIADKYEQVY